ncbi:MAG: alpha/beta hydrolase [Pseudomonadota bacterium]
MFKTIGTRGQFTTNDGVQLSMIEAGRGQPLVMLHGWSQSALQWHNQIDAFAATHRVIALDLRGHGLSERPEHGYRVYRLAQDVRNLIDTLSLEHTILMGHSMGVAIIWALIDLYGEAGLEKLILVDEPASIADHAGLSHEEREEAGALLTPEACFDVVAALKGAKDEAYARTRSFIGGMFTPGASPEIVNAAVAENFALPRRHAAALLADHVFNDWRDVVRRITLPTLCIAGSTNAARLASVAWQVRTIPGARLKTFRPDEGGAHFMFLENPDKFNGCVRAFLAQ